MAQSTVAAVFLAVLLVLAGCTSGGDGGGSTVEPTEPALTQTPTPQGTTPTSPPATAQSIPTDTSTNGTLEVHFINVGQSVSTLVIGPTGETMLIDTGDWQDDGEYVLQYLQAQEIDRIDYLVSSHGDADHIGGNAAVIEYYETEANGIGEIYDQGLPAATRTYDQYLDAVEQYNVTIYRTQAGDRIPMEGVRVPVLAPPAGYLADEERNENSIGLKLIYGETSFLLTGDAEDDGEQYLVETYGSQLRATVMKAGHHGSKSSTSGALLDVVAPQAVVISSAYDSRYGHPNEDVLNRLSERSISTYWTATHGSIVFVSTGQEVSVRTQQSASTTPTELRDGEPIAPGTEGSVTVRETLTAAGGGTTGVVTATVTDRRGELTVTTVQADASGDDRTNLNDEYIVLTNTGDGSLELSGYVISDGSGKTYTVPEGVVLEADESITLYSGSGSDTETSLYWDAGRPVWNNDGDTITIRADDGQIILEKRY